MVTKETDEISAPAATGETLKVASGIPSVNINVHSQEILPNKPVGSLSHERTVEKVWSQDAGCDKPISAQTWGSAPATF